MNHRSCKQNSRHKGQGPSSFRMQDPDRIFEVLNIRPGQHIVDMGCGAGDYAMQAARLTGSSGRVTAMDHWPPTVDALGDAALAAGLSQIRCYTVDLIRQPLPLKDNTADLCMLFTVLHIFSEPRQQEAIFREGARILKPDGILAVMECKKEEWSFGPPLHMRLSPEEVEEPARALGFQKQDYTDFGYNYLIRFSLNPK